MVPIIITPYLWDRRNSAFSILDLPPFYMLVAPIVLWYLCGIVAAGFELANRYAKWPEAAHQCYMVRLHESSRNIQIAFGPASLISVDHSHGWVWPFDLECTKK